jgi:hypothetical protein
MVELCSLLAVPEHFEVAMPPPQKALLEEILDAQNITNELLQTIIDQGIGGGSGTLDDILTTVQELKDMIEAGLFTSPNSPAFRLGGNKND